MSVAILRVKVLDPKHERQTLPMTRAKDTHQGTTIIEDQSVRTTSKNIHGVDPPANGCGELE